MPHELSYDESRPLYSPDGQRYAIDRSREALEAAFGTAQPLVIYVHGRAVGIGEPRKSVERGIYNALESYGVSVVGFTWDADDAGYDETRPIASADAFDVFLDALAKMLNARAGELTKPTLLAHSMGNLIIAELAKDGRLGASRGALFANTVLNAAAVRTKRHHLWLDAVKISERKYVMVNPNDKVLTFAGVLEFAKMLGKAAKGPAASAIDTTYVDLSALGVNHRYFVPGPLQKGQQSLKTFFDQALAGMAVRLDQIATPAVVDGVPFQRLVRNNAEPEAPAAVAEEDEND
jgi:hypothetical protein